MDQHRPFPPHPRHAVVFAGGDPVPPAEPVEVPDGALVIAADSGLVQAQARRVAVHLVVGDFDSAPAESLAAAERDGACLERHGSDKDETDLELALDAAVRAGVESIAVIGGGGGRADHFLANVALLCSPAYAEVGITAHLHGARLVVARPGPGATVSGAPGQLLSLLPVHGTATGVTTSGLRFALHGEPLHAGSPRGLSNIFDEAEAAVSLRTGVLAVIVPHLDPLPSPSDPSPTR